MLTLSFFVMDWLQAVPAHISAEFSNQSLQSTLITYRSLSTVWSFTCWRIADDAGQSVILSLFVLEIGKEIHGQGIPRLAVVVPINTGVEESRSRAHVPAASDGRACLAGIGLLQFREKSKGKMLIK